MSGKSRGRADQFGEALELEAKELQAAIETIDECLAGIEKARAGAQRRAELMGAREQLDRVVELAERAEAAWAPVRDQLSALVLAQKDAAATLRALFHDGMRYEMRDEAFLEVLHWRLVGIARLRQIDPRRRVSLPEFFALTQARATIEQELAVAQEPGR